MRVTKFLQMAVKKGPFARGGLKWKGHGAFRVTQTRKTNAKKRLKYVNENDSVLREAAANDASMTMMRIAMTNKKPVVKLVGTIAPIVTRIVMMTRLICLQRLHPIKDIIAVETVNFKAKGKF